MHARSVQSTHNLATFVTLVTIAVAMFCIDTAAAQPGQTPDAGPMCAPERRELQDLANRLRICLGDYTRATNKLVEYGAKIQSTTHDLQSTHATLEKTRDELNALCVASGTLVVGVVDGQTALPSIGQCVSEATATDLQKLVKSWNDSRTALGHFAAWSAGETDVFPSPPPVPNLGPASLVRRIVGNNRTDAPLPYRRLLVEAVRLMAPNFLRHLRASGSAHFDAWFNSGADLDASFLAEAESVLAGSGLGPRQTASLRLVQSYQDIVGCPRRSQLRDCGRARRLQNFLESSAPLVVRQRVQNIWYKPCAEITPQVVLAWLKDTPASPVSVAQADRHEIVREAYNKLVSCYLAVPAAEDRRFALWLDEQLPDPDDVTSRELRAIDELKSQLEANIPEAHCLDVVHALRNLKIPTACNLPDNLADRLKDWLQNSGTLEAGTEGTMTQACAGYVRALWQGEQPRVLESYPGPPDAKALLRVDRDEAFKATRTLRILCDTRVGSVQDFPANLRRVGLVAAAAQENIKETPWRLDEHGEIPAETARHEAASSIWAWVSNRSQGAGPCDTLGLSTANCRTCDQPEAGQRHYDCALVGSLRARWVRLRHLAIATGSCLGFCFLALLWGVRFFRSAGSFGSWRQELTSHLGNMGLPTKSDVFRFLFPSRMGTVCIHLPDDPAWERWGARAVIALTEAGGILTARDVTRVALSARAHGAELAILCHPEGASPDLGAVRAILDWAARGPNKAMQVLPLSFERLRRIHTAGDLLDLIEQTSLRGNPFEVRGRLVSSSQFFNRERLVSGLISACQSGHWTIVTGLRRFGKSSLALEVARRLQDAHAYVDLAGFHHEVSSSTDSAQVADAILRYVCEHLHASAVKLYKDLPDLPPVPAPDDRLDATSLSLWIRALLASCRKASRGRPVTLLVIFDEVEQAIGVGPERIHHAVDVVSVLVGRMRAVLGDSHIIQGGDRVGVLFCSALHPLLWAPLATLSQQSLLGAFPSLIVPRLPDEAAYAMMRGLGARQGIRFAEAALSLIVREAQGIPILARRIGSSILELYDPERARQGGLGAVEIGIEGATAAVRREEEDGAPLRVWVESEIGDAHNPAGVLLRALAVEGHMSAQALRELAAKVTLEQFESSGISSLLGQDEARRRAKEAAGFIVRLLGETGMLETMGDLTRPEGYRFPESLVRRILATPKRDSVLGF